MKGLILLALLLMSLLMLLPSAEAGSSGRVPGASRFSNMQRGLEKFRVSRVSLPGSAKKKSAPKFKRRKDQPIKTTQSMDNLRARRQVAAPLNGTLAGASLIVAAIEQPPYVYIDNGVVSGWFNDFFIEMSNRLGFDFNYVTSTSFNQSVNDVSNGVVHTGTIISVNGPRSEIVSYSQPYVQNGLIIITREEDPAGLQFSFFRPFETGTWILIVVTIAVYGPVMWCLEGDQNWKRSRNDESYKGRKGLGNAVFDGVLTFSAQGPKFVPRTALGRAFSSCFQFTSLVTIATYTADLTADLTVSERNTRIDSLADLEFATVGVVAGASPQDFLQNTNSVPVGILASYPNIDELLDALEQGNIDAIVEEDTTVEFFLLSEPFCSLTPVDRTFNPGGWALPWTRDASGEAIAIQTSAVILDLNEEGFLAALDEEWIIAQDANQACDRTSSGLVPAGVFELGGLFFLFFMVMIGVLCIHFLIFPGRKYLLKYHAAGWPRVYPWDLPDFDPDEDDDPNTGATNNKGNSIELGNIGTSSSIGVSSSIGASAGPAPPSGRGASNTLSSATGITAIPPSVRTIHKKPPVFTNGSSMEIPPDWRNITIGCGWAAGKNFLKMSTILYEGSNVHFTVDEAKPDYEGCVTFSSAAKGDNLQVRISLEELTEAVDSLLIVFTSASGTIGTVNNPYFRVLNRKGRPIGHVPLGPHGNTQTLVGLLFSRNSEGWILDATCAPHSGMAPPNPLSLPKPSRVRLNVVSAANLPTQVEECYLLISHSEQAYKTPSASIENNFYWRNEVVLEKVAEAPIVLNLMKHQVTSADFELGTISIPWGDISLGSINTFTLKPADIQVDISFQLEQ